MVSINEIMALSPQKEFGPGKLLEMQIIRPHPEPTKSETAGWDPTICAF